MKVILSAVIFIGFFTACSRYPGYKNLTPEIYYSLIQIGEKDQNALSGDFITIILEYRTQKDSVFFSGKRKVRINEPMANASADHCFLFMDIGDSASFILPAQKFFSYTLKRSLPGFISENEYIKLNVRLLEIQTEKEFQAEKQQFLTWATELSEFENVQLLKFIEEETPGINAKPEGFYMVNIKKGHGRKIRKGDHILVNYEGKFLNGKFFDGTYRTKEPVDFIYGTQFVLITGLEQALSYMSEGESAMVILPSGLAFGEDGDDFGIIPPYTSLIYTLEIVKID